MKDKRKNQTEKKQKKGPVTSMVTSENSGRITNEKLGYSLPIDRPLFDPFPYHYKHITILTYEYETDRDAALELLPSQFELPPGPAMAKVIFANFGFSSLGFYNEVAQSITCTYKGEKYVYPTRFHVTSDRAMAAGREILGIPKKIGVISFHKGAEYLSTLESPSGLPICSGVLVPGRKPMEFPPAYSIKYASIRVMPNYTLAEPTGPFTPSIHQLLASDWILKSGEMWSGTGSVHLTGASDLDPYHKLPIIKLHPCTLFMGDMSIESVSLLEDLAQQPGESREKDL